MFASVLKETALTSECKVFMFLSLFYMSALNFNAIHIPSPTSKILISCTVC